jgi:RNA polymerase sigma-70 factor, ECF subfamily
LESHVNYETHQQLSPTPSSEVTGDVEALSNLFMSQRLRLFYCALRLLGNAEDAEDAVQEGLLAALRNLHRFEGRASLSTWLTRIVVNACLMRLRSLRSHDWESFENPIGGQDGVCLSALLVDARPNPEQVCVCNEQRRIINQGLKSLSRPHRRALSLHDLQGMTTKEAAVALGLSEGTVKSQVHRARRRLSEHVRSIHGTGAHGNASGSASLSGTRIPYEVTLGLLAP